MDDVNRRRFLGAAIGTGAAAAAAGAWTPAARAQQGGGGGGRRNVPNNRIGIQLYSLRRLMPNNDRQAVRRMFNWLGRAGYTEVEMAGYYGFTAQQVRNWVDAAGLRAVSGHDGFDLNAPDGQWEAAYEKTLEGAKTMGQQYTGLAWFPGPYTADYFHHLAERMNKAAKMASEAGLQFFYHNHDFEFSNKDEAGKPLYDILLNETDANLVKFELDLYWIVVGGESPIDYLSRDPARYPLYHVKDKTWKDRPNEQDWEDVGPGAIDFPDIFAAGHRNRLDKHFIIEHDWPLLSHPDDPDAEYKTAQTGLNYLREVRW
ncbi:sugar phosphate isomerase/epimerase [Solirubrobacter sp. CPCC 204708]|uniref:Sugar phosphate isomerase/epimerase n=1 Tax=Solirubrobacter deserti TaxID=2282478 RepID=A0ABT4RUR4_9ACTN|nr:sugar phosphate isomerase/epimerase [Solirubrobacter deserti]MBE2319324.1 sugar phosphate isomerase/epimerase [Solirubrobacter deserti]MDA0142314.1 sugar phosphate isomerase/epimerase [Solirubrobacter deserti]